MFAVFKEGNGTSFKFIKMKASLDERYWSSAGAATSTTTAVAPPLAVIDLLE